MVKLLKEDKEKLLVKLEDLHELKETGIPDADLAQRPLDINHIEQLIMSNPKEWPPVLVTRTEEFGYVIYDGYHRAEAALKKGMNDVICNCKSFGSEKELIEATFRANLKHGLKSGEESRANYVWWLYKQDPARKQEEIAQLVGIKQPSVSEIINRRLKREAEAKERARAEQQAQTEGAEGQQAPAHDDDPIRKQMQEQREHIKKYCEHITRDAVHLFSFIAELDEKEQTNVLVESLADSGIAERQRLLTVARLLEKILEPPTIKHTTRAKR